MTPDIIQALIDQALLAKLPNGMEATEGICNDSWDVIKKKIERKKYCPQGEIKKLEIELWNLKVKGNDVPDMYQDPSRSEIIKLKNKSMEEIGMHTRMGFCGGMQEKRGKCTRKPDANVVTVEQRRRREERREENPRLQLSHVQKLKEYMAKGCQIVEDITCGPGLDRVFQGLGNPPKTQRRRSAQFLGSCWLSIEGSLKDLKIAKSMDETYIQKGNQVRLGRKREKRKMAKGGIRNSAC
ncbi:hypothetical protein Tco_0539936 [Tanacetum coccineum]